MAFQTITGLFLPASVLGSRFLVLGDESVGLGPIEMLMRDPSITAIMVNWVRGHDDGSGDQPAGGRLSRATAYVKP